MENQEANGAMPMPKGPMKQAFCVHYATFRNGAKAAAKAGYSERTARQKAYELLQEEEVKLYIKYLEDERLAEANIQAVDVLLELKKVAFSNIGDYISLDEVEGLQIKDFATLTADQLAAVAEVSETPGMHGTARKFKLHSKLDALAQIRAMQGLDQPKKSEVKVEGTGALEATRFTLKRRAAEPGKDQES